MDWDNLSTYDRARIVVRAKMDKYDQIVLPQKNWSEIKPEQQRTLEKTALEMPYESAKQFIENN